MQSGYRLIARIWHQRHFISLIPGLSRQVTAQERNFGSLMSVRYLIPSLISNRPQKRTLELHEINRLNKQQAVVRFNNDTNTAEIYHKVSGETNVLHVSFNKLSEQQIKGVGVLLPMICLTIVLWQKTATLATNSKIFPF